MSQAVKNVILVGASGQAGRPILSSFLKNNSDNPLFNVSVLTRVNTSSTLPTGNYRLIKTDYTPPSLDEALQGQEAVIILLGDSGLVHQRNVIDAAIRTGVKRIFPSEFGARSYDKKSMELMPWFEFKKNTIEYLRRREETASWTGVINGPFFDQALSVGFHGLDHGLDGTNKRFYVMDGGDVPYSTTNLHTIGLALFKILSDPALYAESANRYIHLYSHVTTQNEVLATIERLTGKPLEKIPVDSVQMHRDVIPRARNLDFVNKELLLERDLIQCVTYGRMGGENPGLGDLRDKWDWTLKLELPKEDLEKDIRAVLEKRLP